MNLCAINLSVTPDNRASVERVPPEGLSGISGVFTEFESVTSGADGRPAHRPSALFHELAENYLRTEKTQQYIEAHKVVINRKNTFRMQRPDLNEYVLGAGKYIRRLTD